MFITATSLANSGKIEQSPSDEVLLTITNECRAQIKLYEFDSRRQFLSDVYDCSYVCT